MSEYAALAVGFARDSARRKMANRQEMIGKIGLEMTDMIESEFGGNITLKELLQIKATVDEHRKDLHWLDENIVGRFNRFALGTYKYASKESEIGSVTYNFNQQLYDKLLNAIEALRSIG